MEGPQEKDTGRSSSIYYAWKHPQETLERDFKKKVDIHKNQPPPNWTKIRALIKRVYDCELDQPTSDPQLWNINSRHKGHVVQGSWSN